MASSPSPVRSYSRRNDVCFHCANQGHWAKDCTFKTPQKTLIQSPNPKSPSSSSSIEPGSNFPPFQCPSGHGSCSIRVSQTLKNPGRPFYRCYFASTPSGKCGFFKWCDQVKEGELRSSNVRRDQNQEYPDCRCRAAKCKVVLENGVEYYVCPITKGHGACSFRIRVDDFDASTSVNFDENAVNQSNNLSPRRTDFVSPVVMENPDPASMPSGPSPCMEEIIKDNEECTDTLDLSIHELALRERDLGAFLTEKEFEVSRSPSKVVHRRQAEFLKQIEDAIGTVILGWLGRLVYTPSGHLTAPQAKPFYCCVFPSYDPIYVPKLGNGLSSRDLNDLPPSSYNVLHDLSPQLPNQDGQPSVLLELLSIQNVPGIRQGRDFMRQISKSLVEVGLLVQSELLAILKSTEISNYKSMEEAASKTFVVLNLLSIDHSLFSKCVRVFIACAQSLATIEESMKGKQSSEEIMKWIDSERANFDHSSRVHSEMVDAVIASDERVKLLGEEALRVEAMLLQIRNQLKECEIDNAELKTQTRKMYLEMLESKKKLQEAEATKKLHAEREAERNAAKEALESAKAQLRLLVITF